MLVVSRERERERDGAGGFTLNAVLFSYTCICVFMRELNDSCVNNSSRI